MSKSNLKRKTQNLEEQLKRKKIFYHLSFMLLL